MFTTNVTRLGDFLKFYLTHFFTKVAQITLQVLGYLEKHDF